ncbi:hypothetical protein [Nitrobacter sp. TKz-YC01]|uniref:hypothetical protein n=1 Tax=Nitrobacter sp. TKz-YC01 TaxID=3398703 RepID=UPI003A102035
MTYVRALAYMQSETMVFRERNCGRAIFFKVVRRPSEDLATNMVLVRFFSDAALRLNGGLTTFVLRRSSIRFRKEI